MGDAEVLGANSKALHFLQSSYHLNIFGLFGNVSFT